jgi:predicted RecA/RadA family phage recombinase
MARNYIQPGDVIEVVAPSGGSTAGVGMKVGARMFGVALNTAAEGAPVQLATKGVFTMGKTSALAITAGDVLYWNDTTKLVNKTTGGQIAVGIALQTVADPSPTVTMFVGFPTGAGT